MECLACGSDNQEDSQFCRRCGTPFSVSATSDEMPVEGQVGTNLVSISEDAVVVRQSQWAYMLYAIPLLSLFGVSLVFDYFTFGILPTVITIYIVGSQYLSFRKTAYILTDKHLIIFQGSLFGRKRFDLPFADVNNIILQHGIFGKFLGYAGVRLQEGNQRVISLQYVPLSSPLLEYLRVRINHDSLHQEDHDK